MNDSMGKQLNHKSKKPLSINIYVPHFYPWVYEIEKTLRKRGVTVESYTIGIYIDNPKWRRLEVGYYPEWDAIVKQMNVVPHWPIWGHRPPKLRFYFNIFRKPPDLFFLSNGETSGALLISFLARMKRIPTILLIEDTVDLRKYLPVPFRVAAAIKKMFINLIWRNSDNLLPETGAAKRYLDDIGCVQNNIEIAPHGIDVSEYKPRKPSLKFAKKIGLKNNELHSKLKILYAGGFYKHKGIDIIVQLLEDKLLDENMILFITDFGHDRDYYRSKLSKYNQVQLIPQLSIMEMKKMYSIIDVVLIPSISYKNTERSPNVAMEAMASGKVVIASDMGGIPTVVGDAGFLVPEGDAKSIANKLYELLQNRKILSDYGLKARKYAVRVFSTKAYVDTLLRKYYEFIESDSQQKI